MANPKANYVGVEEIMSGFESISKGKPYYSLWQVSPKELIMQYAGDDYDEAIDGLTQILAAGESKGNCDLMAIKIHPQPKEQFITKSTTVIATMYVRICPVDLNRVTGVAKAEYEPRNNAALDMYKLTQAIDSLPGKFDEKFRSLNDRLAALEEYEPDEVQEVDMIGKITGLMENPNVVNAVMGFVKMIFPQMPAPGPAQIAGVKEVSETVPGTKTETAMTDLEYSKAIDIALDRLEKHIDLSVDLGLLADYAEKNPTMFQMMLKTLRNDK